jgi:SAM-dependent methyltransferase
MTNKFVQSILGFAFCILAAGCSTPPQITAWVKVDGAPKNLAVYKGVLYSMGTNNFREFILNSGDTFKDKTVYDIGTGTGVYAVLAMQAGSKYVVATDIDPVAVLNAKFNAQHFGYADKIDVRLVTQEAPGAYAVLKDNERFDLIISNPPWGTTHPIDLASSLTDDSFMLIRSIMQDLSKHLNPHGSAYLPIGNIYAIKLIEHLAAEQHLTMEILDEKTRQGLINAFSLPPEKWVDGFFLPAAIIKLTPRETGV